MTSKAASAAPVAVKPPCKIHSTATIAEKAQLTGTHLIEIGENAFIHPWAKIRAEHGSVIIGKNCIVSEGAVVGAASHQNNDEEANVVIGTGVNIESCAVVEASRIQDHCTIGPKAQIGAGAVLRTWCTVAPHCAIKGEEVLEDYTVIFGDGQRRVDSMVRDRREVRDARIQNREKEIALLKTLIPDASGKWKGD